MRITLHEAAPADLDEIIATMSTWQEEGASVQLHPGDLGWAWRFGAPALAATLRLWRRDGSLVAVGMVDPGLVRMAIAPSAGHDLEVAEQLVADLSDPARGVLPAGAGAVEARVGAALRSLLAASGWTPDESWTPLRRDLRTPVADCGLRIERLDAANVAETLLEHRVMVGRASFANSTFTADRWRAMADSSAYRQARCLIGYDGTGMPVAATTVWSAGPDRPGLIEPLGAHHDHRGRGYGRAIAVAAAAALRELGSSSATVCTLTANTAGVAAYRSAGMAPLPAVTDFRRPG